MHLFVAIVAFLWLMPPRAGVELSDEAWERYRELGLNRYQAILPAPSEDTRVLVVEGPKRFPVVLMEYTDVEATYDDEDFQRMLFAGPWPSGTAHEYYDEVSYGRVDLTGQVYGPYEADHSSTYYANNEYGIGNDYNRSAGLLVYEACKRSDPYVDYSLYDNDGDGYVDIFTVIHVGYGAEETGDEDDIWSHEFSLSGWAEYGGPGAYPTNDGVKIDVYTMNPELSDPPRDEISNIGVFCHEWGHGFGLPDLYITDGINAGKAGLGDFCLMASGSWAGDPPGSSPVHPCAWCKYFLGWVEPEALERDRLELIENAGFPTSSASPSAYRIFANPSGVDWSFESVGRGEYFLVENRQRIGFDEGLPGDGLLILHVDESKETNSDLENPLVGIMQADGDPDYLFTSGAGRALDLWADDTFGFNNSSIPSSRFYDGAPSGASVTAISPADSVMTARLEIGVLLLGRVYSYPNPFNVHERERVTIVYEPTDEEKAADQYPDFRVLIYNLAGKRVRILDERPTEISRYSRTAFWDGTNDAGRPVASGLYFYIVETLEGSRVVERNKAKMTLLR
ncbi:MAG: M6 family metalloprotease domain-containing protein [Candidatus Stahlbacteria bacterium]|nr:MAG: M6 family metalloprotease domain-containing protein [Candidatus Stahlbacteria bacterium]